MSIVNTDYNFRLGRNHFTYDRSSRKFGHKNVTYIGDIEMAAEKVCDILQPGDLVITLGAGSITGLSDEILASIAKG